MGHIRVIVIMSDNLIVEWAYQYLPESIGLNTTIQGQHPGDKIARAITEIQERVPVAVRIASDSSIVASIEGNILDISGGGGISEMVFVYDAAQDGFDYETDGTVLTLKVGPYVPTGGAEGQVLTSTGPTSQPQWKGNLFTGTYWFHGKRYTLSGEQEAWWYHDVSLNGGVWSADPPGSMLDDEKYWRHTESCGKYVFIDY